MLTKSKQWLQGIGNQKIEDQVPILSPENGSNETQFILAEVWK